MNDRGINMWSIRRGEETGAISVMAAVIVLALLVATSLAVDVGRVGYASRDQQGVTDRAVLDAIRVVSAGTHATLAEVHDAVADAVDESLSRNPGASAGTAEDRTVTNIQLGTVEDTTFTAICESDHSSTPEYDTAAPTCDGSDADPVDAIRADTESLVSFIFAIGDDDGGRIVRRTSVAATEATAEISVGSRLADVDLNDSAVADVVDQLLGQMASTAGATSWPTLTAVGYDGLANASIPLGELAQLDASILSPRSVVPNVEVSLKDLLDVMASGLSSDDAALDAEASSFLADLAAEVDPAFTVDIGTLLHVTTEDEDVAASALVNVWDLLIGSLQVANLNNGLVLSLSNSSGNVLGMEDLYGVDLTATVVEAPQIAIGPVQPVQQDIDGDGVDDDWWATSASTAQVDLGLTLEVGDEVETVFGPHVDSLLGSLLDVLNSLLCLLCADDTEDVDVSIEGASAMAGLSGITCDTPALTTDVFRTPLDLGTLEVDGDVRDLYAGLDEVLQDEGGYVASLEPTGTRHDDVLIDPVPGSTTVGYDTPTSIPMLDAVLEPVLAMLGVDLGTAEVRGNWVDCDSRRLAYVE